MPCMPTPAQIRAARGLLAWTQTHLAKQVGVSGPAIHMIEAGTTRPRPATQERIRQVLEEAGVRFVSEDGFVGVMTRDETVTT